MQSSAVASGALADLTKRDYIDYHDREWGAAIHDDRRLFEFLTLEAAQAGLSWYTVLRKRHGYRVAFDHFDPEKAARYDEQQVASLLGNPGTPAIVIYGHQ